MTNQPWQPAVLFVLAVLGLLTSLLALMYVFTRRNRDRMTPHG
jgi:hypothetical protein